MIGRFLYDYLTSQPNIVSLVGNKVYPLYLPQNVQTPAIVYFIQDQRLVESKTCYPYIFRSSILFNLWVDVDMGQEAYDTLEFLELQMMKSLHGVGDITLGNVHLYSSKMHMVNSARDDTFLSFMKTMQFLMDYKIEIP